MDSQAKSMRIHLNPASAIRSRSLSWPVTKWMFTPTPAGITKRGLSLARTVTGNNAPKSSERNFITAILTRSIQFAISRKTLHAAFAAEAAFLVAAKGAGGIEFVVGVGPDDAGAEVVHHLENLAAFVGPDAGTQAIRSVVGALEGFFGCAKGHHAEDGAENFLLCDAMRGGDAGKKTRTEPIALVRHGATGLHEFGAFVHAALHQLADLFKLRFGIDRADVSVFIERIADAESLDAVGELADDLFEHTFLHEQARTGAADVALIEINSRDDAFDGLVDRRVLKNDVRRLATEFEREFFVRAGERFRDELADVGRAGERDFVDVGMLDDGRAGFARAGDDIDNAFGKFGFLENLREAHRGDAGGLGGFDHNRVAAGERGSDLPRGHEQREIPGDNLADDAEGFRGAAGEGVLELVCPAGVIKEMRGDERKIDIAAFLDGLAAVYGLEHGEFAGFFLDDARDAVKIFAALASGHFAPDFVVRAAGSLHGLVHVRRSAEGDLGQLAFGGGIDGVEIFASGRRDEFAVDEQLVPRRDDVALGILGRGRVIPFVAERELARVQRHHGVARTIGLGDSALGGKFDRFEFGFHGKIISLVCVWTAQLVSFVWSVAQGVARVPHWPSHLPASDVSARTCRTPVQLSVSLPRRKYCRHV